MRRGIVIAVGLAFFMAVGWTFNRLPAMTTLRNCLRSPVVPTGMLNYGSLGQGLRQLHMVKPVGNDQTRFPTTPSHEENPSANLFQKKRHVTKWLYAANGFWGDNPSSRTDYPRLPADAFKSNWPTISIRMATQDLFDAETGIVSNFYGTGREWERPAQYTFYLDGRPVLDGRAGLRLHGGKSRAPGARHSFRLHFRQEYGRDGVPMDIFFDDATGTLYRLILHADWPQPFTSCLAYDIARQIGCDTVRTCPAIFYLNDVPQGIYFLSEQVSRRYGETKTGKKDFLFYVYKGNSDPDSQQAYDKLHDWARDFSHPMSLEDAARHIDVTNLSQYILAIAFGGVTDGFQGAALFDSTRPLEARWRWIPWDLDHSFWDNYPRGKVRAPWEKEGFRLAIETPADTNFRSWKKRGDIRAILFTRLMTDSPEYRSFFHAFLEDQLANRINPAFLQSRVDHYASLAASYGLTNTALFTQYAEFMESRPDFLRQEIRQYFPPDRAAPPSP